MTDLISRAAVLDILNTPQGQDTFPDMIRRVEALPGGEAQCCMCGKTGLSVVEDGGPECELHDGRWVCGSDCWEMAARILAALEPTPPDDVSGGETFKRGMLRAAEIAIKCAEESKQDPGTGWASHSWLMTVGRIIQAEAAALASAPPAVQECEG